MGNLQNYAATLASKVVSTTRTITYRNTKTLGDTLQSLVSVSRIGSPTGLFELSFSTKFSQAKNPDAPRVQHRIYATATELDQIVTLIREAVAVEDRGC